MRILTTLTYYAPHISGLTVYARRIIAGLVGRGHEVTVLTSHYQHDLPLEESIDGARVVRVPVWLRLNKGVLMPGYYRRALAEVDRNDLLLLHLPQLEAFLPALHARFAARKPVVTVYHCDIDLPPGLARTAFFQFIRASHWLTARASSDIIVNSEDYIDGTPFLRRFPGKVRPTYPPCLLPPAAPYTLDIDGDPVIGFVGRFAEEKGIEYIIEAAPHVLERHPQAVFAFVGEREKVFGERAYERVRPRLEALGDRVRLLGILPSEQLANFYRRCSVVLLPSVNSTESFGMVQAEAMLAGTPVIASDRPGVRVPVTASGMGLLVPPRSAPALAEAIERVLGERERFLRPPEEIESLFGLERALDYFEALFARRLGQPEPAPRALAVTEGRR